MHSATLPRHGQPGCLLKTPPSRRKRQPAAEHDGTDGRNVTAARQAQALDYAALHYRDPLQARFGRKP